MNIVLVEDDHHQREEILRAIRERYPGVGVRIISTESEFMQSLDGFEQRPDVFLIDIMLRWTDPSPDMPPRPPDANFNDAGFRCARELQRVMEGMPTVLYTVLDPQDIEHQLKSLPSQTRYVRKSSDFRQLFDTIAELLKPKARKP